MDLRLPNIKGVGGRSFSVASRPPIAASRAADPKLPGSRLLQVQAYGTATEAVAEQPSGDHFCIPVLLGGDVHVMPTPCHICLQEPLGGMWSGAPGTFHLVISACLCSHSRWGLTSEPSVDQVIMAGYYASLSQVAHNLLWDAALVFLPYRGNGACPGMSRDGPGRP